MAYGLVSYILISNSKHKLFNEIIMKTNFHKIIILINTGIYVIEKESKEG
jgi:hypothetical protein